MHTSNREFSLFIDNLGLGQMLFDESKSRPLSSNDLERIMQIEKISDLDENDWTNMKNNAVLARAMHVKIGEDAYDKWRQSRENFTQKKNGYESIARIVIMKKNKENAISDEMRFGPIKRAASAGKENISENETEYSESSVYEVMDNIVEITIQVFDNEWADLDDDEKYYFVFKARAHKVVSKDLVVLFRPGLGNHVIPVYEFKLKKGKNINDDANNQYYFTSGVWNKNNFQPSIQFISH